MYKCHTNIHNINTNKTINICVYIHTYIYIHIAICSPNIHKLHNYVFEYTCADMCERMRVCVILLCLPANVFPCKMEATAVKHTYIYIYTHMHVYIYRQTYMHTCKHVHVYVYTAHLHTHMFIYSTSSFVGLDPWGLDPGAWKKPKLSKSEVNLKKVEKIHEKSKPVCEQSNR